LRLVLLDTTRPGEDPGALDAERLDWLDGELAAAPGISTLLAMHHPPLVTGVPAWDELALPAADRRGLAQVLARHGQALLNFGSEEIELVDEPAGFALHAVLDGELISHVQPVH
jgi:3',5'-cyclic AMP phosphodiesterase CpdA